MARRLLATTALLLPLLAGCAEGRDLATRVEDCAGLAQDLAAAGLDRTPTQAEAEQAVSRLDNRIEQLGDEELKQAASRLRDRLRSVQEAVRSADPAAAQSAATEARDAARDVAATCGIPVDQLLAQ
jgi:septal ring factor EnvC (AmiA/AmiB activator)